MAEAERQDVKDRLRQNIDPAAERAAYSVPRACFRR
jgi:hypothetical protein